MKQSSALADMIAAIKDFSLLRDRKECDGRPRERMEGELDRVRTRDRLEATLAGLGELEYLRQRQELLVRTVLNYQDSTSAAAEEKVCAAGQENYLHTEEKLLEENILLLRKQLNCLRRRDAGLVSQLQELDRQISDLRLDAESSLDHADTDSRPSSGFYELSDGVSGSLSNSSNSVFSECLSSCRSSTCLCAALDASLGASEGRPKSADELGVCAECEGQGEDQLSGTVRRSVSGPYSTLPQDGSADGPSKFHCDLVARNGSDVYRYPSPLHAVAVQSPVFIQSISGCLRDDVFVGKPTDPSSSADVPKPESAPAFSQTPASWPAPGKRVESYILGLLQRRAQPLRTGRPRTSISTDPSKSVLRQASLCARPPTAAQVVARTPELRTGCTPAPSASGSVVPATAEPSAASPLRRSSLETKAEQAEARAAPSACHPPAGCPPGGEALSGTLLKRQSPAACKVPALREVCKDPQSPASPGVASRPNHTLGPEDGCTPQPVRAATPKNGPKAPVPSDPSVAERDGPDLQSLGSSSQSQDEGGQLVSARYIPAHKQSVKLRKGGSKHVKIVKVKSATTTTAVPVRPKHHGEPVPASEQSRDRHQTGSRRSRPLEGTPQSHRSFKKPSCRRRIPAAIPEGRVLEKQQHAWAPSRMSTASGSNRHHGSHGREPAILAKPKHKRSDYRGRLRGVTGEVSYEEAYRRANRRHRREAQGRVTGVCLPADGRLASPYAYMGGSESEYSAECASLFHSTILDTSEDERSNYTTNRFGDSESSPSEGEGDAHTSSGSESEGSAGANWRQFGPTASGSSAQTKAFVKIKASHTLKKRILRFRSGSLKLMTTV